jgi:nucleoside-diphosphate-sugar epimerase
MMHLLITGHNGYLGRVMARFLEQRGHFVVGLDTGFYEDCGFGPALAAPKTIARDTRDVKIEHLKRFDALIHLAALSNDPLGELVPQWTDEINHQATVRLARLARDAGIKRFLFSSSCSMYGTATKDGPITEDAPLRPLTQYAISKVKAEEALFALADADFSPVFLRNSTAYGVSPALRADLVLNNLVGWAYTTGKIKIMSDGSPWRPLVHVEDIARAFAAVLEAPREVVHNQAFNVGVNSENYQVRDLAQIVQETVPGCSIEYAGQADPDNRTYIVDFSKLARNIPSFQPKWNVRKGAIELHRAYQDAQMPFDEFQGRKYIRIKQLKYLLDEGRLDQTLRWRRNRAIAA